MTAVAPARLEFRPGPDAEIARFEVGPSGHQVVVVDNFLADPEHICWIADRATYSTAHELILDFPGERALIDAETVDLRQRACDILGGVSEPLAQSYPLTLSRSLTNVELAPSQRQPHRDPTMVGLIYLNRDQDCVGGTATYRHRPTGRDFIPCTPDGDMLRLARSLGYEPSSWTSLLDYEHMVRDVFFHDSFASTGNETVNDGNEYWEMTHLVEMKFNRLVLFDGQIPHSEFTPEHAFDDTHRIVQLLSIPLPTTLV